MKKLLAVAVLISLAALSCFDDDPADPKEDNGESSPYSGSFIISSVLTGNDCDYAAAGPLSTLQIVVIEDVIAIGTAIGTWNENELSGIASSGETCVPIPVPYEDCVRCFDFTYDITYADPDSFTGTYTVHFAYSIECQTDDCYTTYDIEGVR